MCGLAFALARRPVSGFVEYAGGVQRHRGPDGEVTSCEQMGEVHFGLAHQRLAIFDLSDNGRQPMDSHSGRMTMVYNGEIYNFPELAQQFGIATKTNTDSEVVLELIEQIGIEEASRRFNGMWAIACLDRKTRRMYLSRDRFGKKPIHYLQHDGGFFGASELKSFLGVSGFQPFPDLVAAGQFLAQSLQNVSDRTWLKGVRTFPAASTGYVDVANPERGLQQVGRFWSLSAVPDVAECSGEDLVEEVRELVTDSVRLRSRADVPVAIALSGGLDSSILAAVSDKLSSGQGDQVQLFSVVHPGEKNDESRFVELLAQSRGLNVQTFSLDVSASELDELVRTANWSNDGPIPSFAPLLFNKLIERARFAGFKVVLTGQGGDEAFCGYRKYPLWYAHHLLRRRPLAGARFLTPFLTRGTLLPQLNWREAKRYLTAGNVSVLGDAAKECFAAELLGRNASSLSQLQIGDIERFSVPYLCHYEDRQSMACSVEVRSPFLDYRVVSLGVSLPAEQKMGAGWSKYILRKAFSRDLPREIAWRKDKMGFGNPEDSWLKSMAPAVREQMADQAAPVYSHGIVDRAAYLKQFDRYVAGDKTIWFREVFAPYSLNSWLNCLNARA